MSLRESGHELSDPHDDVRSLAVLDPDGHRVGTVEDLIIDETHRRARLLLVTSGGVLGLGKNRRFIPVDLVTRVDEDVRVARDHQAVYADPTATTDEAADDASNPDTDDPEPVAAPPYKEIYAYYGLTPFWGLDYVTAYFHRR